MKRCLSNRGQKYVTLPETNIAPENRPSQKETIVFQPSIFRDYVSFREGIFYTLYFVALPFGARSILCGFACHKLARSYLEHEISNKNNFTLNFCPIILDTNLSQQNQLVKNYHQQYKTRIPWKSNRHFFLVG